MLACMEADEKGCLPETPATRAAGLLVPQRARIYIDVDGTVHFGDLFEDLVPVARSLSGRAKRSQPVAPGGPNLPSVLRPDRKDDE